MSSLLLDSHVVLWLLDDSPRLSPSARQAISVSNVAMCSAVSLWELTLKQHKGKVSLPPEFVETVRGSGLVELPLSSAHITALDPATLPHCDPFDHMLIAQARVEGLTLVTADTMIIGAGLPFVLDARK